MKLSRSLFVVPAACIGLAAAVASGACSSSVSLTTPPIETAPTDYIADGYLPGGACAGDVYVAGSGTSWLFCDNGTWAYTTTDPGDDGYSPDTTPGKGFVSVSISTPPVEVPPAGFTAGDFAVGEDCSGDVYVVGDGGYLFCDDGVWSYTTTDPSADGYTVDVEAESTGDESSEDSESTGDESDESSESTGDEGSEDSGSDSADSADAG